MVSERVVIMNPTGLHLRPAGLLCKEALKFHSKVTLQKKGVIANAKSVLSVLAVCAKKGDELLLVCEGEDEEEALSYIVELFKSRLGE